jgi:hypothetical protein
VTREELVAKASNVLMACMDAGTVETKLRAVEIVLCHHKAFSPAEPDRAPINPDRAPMNLTPAKEPAKHSGFSIG